MAERPRHRRARLGATLVAALTLALAPAAGAAGPTPAVTGWLSAGATYPQRALDLFAPSGHPLSAANLRVTENGARVRGLTVTPTSSAGAGDFGLVVAIDGDVNMATGTLAAELSAARTFATARTGNQQLGVVAYDGAAHVLAPLTTSASQLGSALAHAPAVRSGDAPGAAITTAVAMLSRAHVAMGAVVLFSDGVGLSASSDDAAARAAALAANVPVITIGVNDRASSAASLAALARLAPGAYAASSPALLPATAARVESVVTRGYVARWSSRVPHGTEATVLAAVTGLAGAVHGSYLAPGKAPAARHPKARPAPRTTPATIPVGTLSPRSSALSSAAAPPAAPAGSSTGNGATFWNSPAALTLAALIAGSLLAVALFTLFYRPVNRAARTRVGSYVPVIAEGIEDPVNTLRPGQAQQRKSLAASSHWWAMFVEDVAIARSPRSPSDLVKRAMAGAFVFGALLTFVAGSPLFFFLPIIAAPLVLRAAMRRAARKQREKFAESLPGYLQDLASAMRVGRSFIGAITVVADGADEPTRGEFERVVTDEALGLPLEECLEQVGVRMQSGDMDQVALVAALNRRSGSNVAEALDRVADGARDRADMRREVKALTAQAKMSSSVLTALPGLLLGAISLISPAYAKPLLHSTMGIVLLVVGAGMVFAGWKAMKKISDVKV